MVRAQFSSRDLKLEGKGLGERQASSSHCHHAVGWRRTSTEWLKFVSPDRVSSGEKQRPMRLRC